MRDVYDRKLTEMLEKVAKEVKEYSLLYINHIKKLSKIGIALTAERDINKILEMIVEEAKNFTNADAGTLYSVKGDHLKFEILYNDTMNVKLGGSTGRPITLPPVPIKKETVSGYVALTGEIINIDDVYENKNFDFSGPKKYDAQTGYRSRSFLVVPMRDYEDTIIGVLQLINAKDKDSGEVIPFSSEYEDIIFSLASQAAVAITNVRLIHDIENMLDSFVKVMATAIDERSPYNKRHTERVAKYTVALARKVNDITDGDYSDLYFTEDELNELNMASWLHDVGKVTTPEYVMDKATKLDGRYDGIEFIKQRLELFIADCKVKYYKRKIKKKEMEQLIEKIVEYKEFLTAINMPTEYMTDEKLERLEKIYKDCYITSDGDEKVFINDFEFENLSIRKGTLTDEERKIMQNHVVVTYKLLEKMPFIKKYKNVPEIAASHHEKLNGKGYPFGKKDKDIPVGGKIMAIADFFDALTASDRPYKKAMSIEKAFSILENAAENGEIDKTFLDIFKKYKIYEVVEKWKENE